MTREEYIYYYGEKPEVIERRCKYTATDTLASYVANQTRARLGLSQPGEDPFDLQFWRRCQVYAAEIKRREDAQNAGSV